MRNELSSLPRTLPFRGRSITYSGKGRAAGSVVYLDGVRQHLMEFFQADVMTTGPAYSMVSVPGNPALGKIRVHHSALSGEGLPRVGDSLLIGEIEFGSGGHEAKTAWCITSHRGPGRQTGTVIFYQGTWGKITRDQDGQEVFVHETQVRATSAKRIGSRVSFVAADNGRGLAAFDVHAA
jgi:cold shock CspA family protein